MSLVFAVWFLTRSSWSLPSLTSLKLDLPMNSRRWGLPPRGRAFAGFDEEMEDAPSVPSLSARIKTYSGTCELRLDTHGILRPRSCLPL